MFIEKGTKWLGFGVKSVCVGILISLVLSVLAVGLSPLKAVAIVACICLLMSP